MKNNRLILVAFTMIITLNGSSKTVASELLSSMPQEHKEQVFLRAVAIGDTDLVEKMLSHGVNPNAQNVNGENAFMIAENLSNSTLQRLISEYGGYLPLSIVDYRLKEKILDLVELKKFLVGAVARIKRQDGNLKRRDFQYLTGLKTCYQLYKSEKCKKEMDSPERLIAHCIHLGEHVMAQSF